MYEILRDAHDTDEAADAVLPPLFTEEALRTLDSYRDPVWALHPANAQAFIQDQISSTSDVDEVVGTDGYMSYSASEVSQQLLQQSVHETHLRKQQ